MSRTWSVAELVDAGAVEFDELAHDFLAAANHVFGRAVKHHSRFVQEDHLIRDFCARRMSWVTTTLVSFN